MAFLVEVIIHKLSGEVSLVEQDAIKNVFAAYLRLINILLRKSLNFLLAHGIPAFCDFTICDPRYFMILFQASIL